MAISMYQASVPVFTRALRNLRAVLQKGEAFADERGFAPEVLLQMRLIADMLPLARQIQIATDMAKNGACRLAGIDPPKFEDDETTFPQMYARIERAIAVIEGVEAGSIDGSEARPVSFMTRTNGEMKFDGQGYLLTFVLPNLYFHSSITYALLREAGVPLGKTDFIGQR